MPFGEGKKNPYEKSDFVVTRNQNEPGKEAVIIDMTADFTRRTSAASITWYNWLEMCFYVDKLLT